MIRRYTWALIMAGGIAAGGAVASFGGSGSSPAVAQATTGNTTSAMQLASQVAAMTPGQAGTSLPPFQGLGRPGHDGQFGGGLSVTAVSGNTITATGRGGQKITVQVSAGTTYTRAGAGAVLSDIVAGTRIAVQGTSTTTGTITATSIAIVLPAEDGVVTAVNGSNLTVTGRNATSHTIVVSATTTYQKAGQNAALSDIAVGASISAEGTTNSDGSLSALRVTIEVPRLGGQVSAVNGTSYTVAGRNSTSYTITTSSSTTFVNADGSAATAATVKVGVVLMAEGTLSSDGKTLSAQRVTILPAGSGPSGGHGGGHGPHDDGGTTIGGTTTGTTSTTNSQSI